MLVGNLSPFYLRWRYPIMLLNIGHIASLFCAFGDTVQNMPVDTVYIQAQRVEFCQLGRVKLDFQNSTSPQTLQNNLAANAVFFKQYGVSGSSTISRRGADAAQTQVLWNGLPVNNPMLGMADFNNLTAFGLQEVFLIEGGNAALLGSGSVGGTVFLRNKVKYGEGFNANITSQYGQFGNLSLGLNLIQSAKNHYFQFTFGQLNYQNKFTFFDVLNQENKIAQNANLFQTIGRAVYGFKQGNHDLKLVVEYANNERGLGQKAGGNQLNGLQKDLNLRSVLEHQYNQGKYLWVNRLGFVRDQIKYYEDMVNADSSVASTPYFQTEFYKNIGAFRWLIGFDAQQQRAFSVNYIQVNPIRFYAASFASVTFKLKQADFNLNARHEFYENIPTFGISSVVPVKKWFQIKSNIHSTFRRPTLNDLFWRTNATEIAKSEKGWGVELGLLKNIQSTFVDATFELTSYYRELKDPIIWIPNGVSWIATNFHNGQYAGIQFNGKVSKGYINQKIALNFGGEWVSAHVKKGFEQLGYAQIFIPDFMGFVGVILDRKLLSYKIDIQHTGNRYIQTDNLAWMPGYRIVNCQVLMKQWQFTSPKNHKKVKCEASVECRNMLNTNYQNMPSRPMPGRSFWLNLSILI